MPEQPSLAILISGSGSNLQAFIDAIAANTLEARIAVVIANKPQAFGLERAAKAGIATEVIEHSNFASREIFDQALASTIASYSVQAVVLAGFMRILSPQFVQQFHGRLFNIHPSLLPKYPGLNTHQRALEAGDSHAGATVHFVTEELDGGPAIVHTKLAIKPNETAESLAARILVEEHKIYPLALNWFLNHQLSLSPQGALLNQVLLPETGIHYEDCAEYSAH